MNRKKIYKEKRINVPFYPTVLLLVFTNNGEYINNKYETEVPENFLGVTSKINVDKYNTSLVAFNLWYKNTPVTHGAVAHEAMHMVGDVFTLIGQSPSFVTSEDETIAYFLEWIVDQVYKFAEECGFYKYIKLYDMVPKMKGIKEL